MSVNKSHVTYKDLKESVMDVRQSKTYGVRLQSRDYQILRFILDQKFASLEALYFRFFDVRLDEKDPLPKNLWTARQRLAKLRSLALIKTEKVLSSGRAHYLLTSLGYETLKGHSEEAIIIKPTKRIDFSLYEHDVRVCMLRSFVERRGKAVEWYSEKWLKSSALYVEGYEYGFSKDLRPDAVFLNPKGERIALEFELSQKGSRRVADKIRLYEELLRSHAGFIGSSSRPQILDKVWVVAMRPPIYRQYKKIIQDISYSRSRFYRVDLYGDVIPECAR